MWVGGQRHAPVALRPRKRPGTDSIGHCVDPSVGLDGRGKSPTTPRSVIGDFVYFMKDSG